MGGHGNQPLSLYQVGISVTSTTGSPSTYVVCTLPLNMLKRAPFVGEKEPLSLFFVTAKAGGRERGREGNGGRKVVDELSSGRGTCSLETCYWTVPHLHYPVFLNYSASCQHLHDITLLILLSHYPVST